MIFTAGQIQNNNFINVYLKRFFRRVDTRTLILRFQARLPYGDSLLPTNFRIIQINGQKGKSAKAINKLSRFMQDERVFTAKDAKDAKERRF